MTTRATCVCCRNLGVLPSTGAHTAAVAQPDGSVRMVEVPAGVGVPGHVIQQMCDDCTIAAFLDPTHRHPHRMSLSLYPKGLVQ